MWNRHKRTDAFSKPWLLRFFDQIRFFEVSHDELMQIRQDFPHGRYPVRIEETDISLATLKQVADDQSTQIHSFTEQREKAFAQELAHWRKTGQFNIDTREPEAIEVNVDWPDDCVVIESPVSGSLWQCSVKEGDAVDADQSLLILESMKMEIAVTSPDNLRVKQVLFDTGQRISAGQPLIVLEAL
jgi:urea carboxylase